MATPTTSTLIQELYTDVVADIKNFVDDATLLTNPQFMMNMYNLEGSAGNTVRVPLQNAFTDAASITPGQSIIGDGAEYSYNPTEVDITMTKYGVGSDIYEDALEDGGIDVVRNQLLLGLSGGIAQAVDTAGFATMITAANVAGNQDGNSSVTGAGTAACVVMSPMALAAAQKRQPTVKMWFDPDTDKHEFRATTRFGWAALPNGSSTGIRILNDSATVGSAALTLADFAKSVAQLRAGNHATMASGFYAGFVNPAVEFALASELSGVAASSGSVGDLSDLGNSSLVNALIGQAVGIAFARTNNLAQGL